ncbi:MAG: TonB-dependent receptor [Anaerolineae bacterium]|nr:TonB-dependent receptor [Gloeobacterales cyanobacterium ES-bin-313]
MNLNRYISCLGIAWCLVLQETTFVLANPDPSLPQLRQQARTKAADLLAQNATERPDPPTAQRISPISPVADTDEANTVLDEVTVTATRRAVRQRETTTTTYVVSQRDFKATAAQTLTDALTLVPGFTGMTAPGGIAPAGAGGANNLFFLRGFDDQRFQILRDGRSLQRPANGRTDISRFSVDTLERIEVVSGGATLRYGAGAVGGVINLITQTPKGPPKLTLSYQAGSYGFNKYLAKYGGGDDTFSYNLVYSGLVAFNDYPYSVNMPNQAIFYGPTVNPQSIPPNRIAPANYPNGRNSLDVGGPAAGDLANSGAIVLFGFLKPEVGPPVAVRGVNNTNNTALDNYTIKLVFKPDPKDRLILDLNLQNYTSLLSNPGSVYRNACFGGASAAANPVLALNRFSPVDWRGNPLPCDQQRYVVRTPTSTQTLPFNYNTSLDGVTVFPTGQSYPSVEAATADSAYFLQVNQVQTDTSLIWEHDLSPTTSLNSYVSFYRFVTPRQVPPLFAFNTNVELGQPLPGPPGQRFAPFSVQPYTNGRRWEVQSAVTSQLSPGHTLNAGVQFLEDFSFQQPTVQASVFERAIARLALFVTNDINFDAQWNLNIGFRYTLSSQFGAVGTPAFGVRYSPNRWLSLRSNWSQVFTAPALSNLFAAGANFLANPGLRPEAGITYDIGADITPANNLSLRLTYFETYIDGFFTNVAIPNPNATNPASPSFGFNFLTQPQNLGSRRASGFELDALWRLDEQWQARVAWTNSDVRNYGLTDQTAQPTFPYFYGYQDPLVPFNALTASLSYSNRGWFVALNGHYDGGKRRPNSLDLVPAFATLDLALEVPLTHSFTLTANVLNLTDSQYELIPGAPAPGTTFRLGGRVEVGE